MPRAQTMVQLTDELVEELDAEATRRGISRSTLIREALDAHLAAIRSNDIGRRIVAGYRAHPPETPDAWGDLQRSADVSLLELMQRLDTEERIAGHDRW